MENSKLLEIAKSCATKYAAEELEVLKRMVSIDSGTGDIEGNAKVVAVAEEVLSRIKGVQIERHFAEGYGTHLVARLRPENPTGTIVLNCHLDTVFQKGDNEKFPFRVEGDTMYGLGAVDCKGGFVVSAYAVRCAQEAGVLPNKEILMIYNCDEEVGSPSGYPFFEKVARNVEVAFMYEPSRDNNGVLTSRKGIIQFEIQVKGRSAHAGVNYLAGASATMELAHKLLALREKNIPEKNIFFNVADLKSSEKNNVVPEYASASGSVRVSNEEENLLVRSILAEVEQDTLIEGTTSAIQVTSFGYPMPRNEGNLRLYEFVRKAGAIMGQDLPEQASGGSGDAGWFSYHGVPSVDALGPYMYKIHATDESGKVSSIEEKTALSIIILGLIDSEWK